DPWQPTAADVAAIHAHAFQACREALAAVRSQGRSTSVLLHGQPGSGKTHLLRRFRAHVLGGGQGGAGPPLRAVFTSARRQTTARLISPHVPRSRADDLLRPAGGATQLDDILLYRLARIRGAEGDLRLWWQWLKDEHPGPDAFERLLDDLLDALDAEAD